MAYGLEGVEIGVPQSSDSLYYPQRPDEIAGAAQMAKPLSVEPGVVLANGKLANPEGRNLVKDAATAKIFAMDLLGVIFLDERRIQITPSTTDCVAGWDTLRGDGGLFLVDEKSFTLTGVSTHRWWRAEQLENDGARVTRLRDGRFIAQLLPIVYYPATDGDIPGSVIAQQPRHVSTW